VKNRKSSSPSTDPSTHRTMSFLAIHAASSSPSAVIAAPLLATPLHLFF
jgi:hypothetical protein